MPFTTPAPSNKRKKANKIITDLSHISQNGKTHHTTHIYRDHRFTNSMKTSKNLPIILVLFPRKAFSYFLCGLIIQPSKCQIRNVSLFGACSLPSMCVCVVCILNCVGVNCFMWS